MSLVIESSVLAVYAAQEGANVGQFHLRNATVPSWTGSTATMEEQRRAELMQTADGAVAATNEACAALNALNAHVAVYGWTSG